MKTHNLFIGYGVPWRAQHRMAALSMALLAAAGSARSAAPDTIEIIANPAENTTTPFQLGDTPEGEFTGFRNIIEKEKLQQAGGSLAEVVAAESGVQYRQSGGSGSFSTISLRGSTAEQVNVYVDGILLNEAAGGGVNLSHIELLQADKVEVYRGTVPVQLGNSAIGGAISITSTRATHKPLASLLAGFGSFGSSRISTSFTGPANWLNGQQLVASFSHRTSDNNFSFLNDNGTPLNPDDDETQQRRNAQTRSTSGFLKSGHQLSSGAKLEHALQLSEHQQGISNWRNTARGTATLDTDNIQWRSTLSNTATAGHWSSLLGAHFSKKNEIYDDSDSTIGTGRQKINAKTSVLGGRVYREILLDRQSLSFNIRARSESLDSKDELRDSNTTMAQRYRVDLNAQWNRYYGDGSNLFSASLFGFNLKDDYQIENNTNARRDYRDSALTPQLGLHHALGESLGGQWKFIANASQHKRAPSFFDLFGSQGLFQGNSDLQAESSTNVDLGVAWQLTSMTETDATLQLAWFQNKKENLISRVYNARGVGRSENISRASTNGLEVAGNLKLANGLSFNANLTLQDSENLSRISGFTGKQLPGESALDGSFTVQWKNRQWKATYEYTFNSDRFYDSPNLLAAVDQKTHNARLSRYWKHWRCDLELTNLSNQNYEDFNGYPKPGRAGFISITYQPKPETAP